MKNTPSAALQGISIVTALAAIIGGCATPGQGQVGAPVAGGQTGCGMSATVQSNKMLSGALIGAGVGTVIGAAAGHGHIKNVAGGAAVGALVGGGIGAYMDHQESTLRKDLAGSGIEMARSGDNIILTLPEGILFASGKSALTPQARQGLDRLVGPLLRFEKTTVTVCGYTDNVGTRELNQRLSTDRARSVSDYLGQRGIPPQRLSYLGLADDHPIGDNRTAPGRAMNRRVEILLRPISG